MYKVRRATVDGIPILIEFRGKMFSSMDEGSIFKEIRDVCEEYFNDHIKDDTLVAWIVETNVGEAVACITASFYELPPKPKNISGKYMYVFNFFTEPGHRRKGFGKWILSEALEYAKEIGVKNITFHASEMGKPLFISQGFLDSNEMSIVVE